MQARVTKSTVIVMGEDTNPLLQSYTALRPLLPPRCTCSSMAPGILPSAACRSRRASLAAWSSSWAVVGSGWGGGPGGKCIETGAQSFAIPQEVKTRSAHAHAPGPRPPAVTPSCRHAVTPSRRHTSTPHLGLVHPPAAVVQLAGGDVAARGVLQHV